jgi:hypothetical protein
VVRAVALEMVFPDKYLGPQYVEVVVAPSGVVVVTGGVAVLATIFFHEPQQKSWARKAALQLSAVTASGVPAEVEVHAVPVIATEPRVVWRFLSSARKSVVA